MTSPPRIARPGRAKTSPAETQAPEGRAAMGLTRISLGKVFHAESADYVFLLGITMFMVVFGLIMVLSSSSVDSHVADDSFFAKFMKQGMFAMIGVPLMLIASRLPPRFWKKWAWAALFGACGLQLLVIATPLGVGAYGNKNWLQLGSLPALQPSEAIKVAMVLWLGMFFAKKHDRVDQWRYTLLPAVLVMGVAIALVLAGSDLGTVLIMAGILIGALFFAGVPMRQLVVTFVIGAVLVLALFVLLTIAFLRIYHANTDPGARVTTAAVMVWLIGQGLVNIGVVLGVLPVLGVPLPLISSGGTALISSLVAIGIVLSFARAAPARKAATERRVATAGRPTAASRRIVRR